MLTKKQIGEIKEHLDKAQNPLFLFDNDNDGLCSFLLLQRYIGRGKGFPVKTSPKLTEDYFRKVRELEPDYVFILDQPEVSKEFFDKVREVNIPVVWIDHHEIEDNEVPDFVNYYNPVFNKKKSNEPVTALCYQITNKKEDRWVAVIGCISDKFIPSFYSGFRKDFGDLTIDSKDAFEIYYNSKIGEIATMFSFALMDRTTNVINMLKFLMKVKGPYDVLEENSETYSMHKRSNELYEKYNELIKKAKEEIKASGKLFFFKYGGETGMNADIANRLRYLFPEKIIVVVRVNEYRASFSIRGKNIRGKVLKVIENIEGATGGGHEDAVGAQMKAEDLKRFEKELRKTVE
jgi:single-stranded DNA-specific DHH superfamily exonuclease